MYAEDFQNTNDAECVNQEYFDGYTDLSVHRVMLEDGPRMDFYWRSLHGNSDSDEAGSSLQALVKDAVVVDIGAGTGVLSMWAAKAGAKKVFAVEGSTVGSTLLQALIADNGLEDTVTVVSKELEALTGDDQVEVTKSNGGGVEQVDKLYDAQVNEFIESHKDVLSSTAGISIVVSEWMGFYLLHECMLPSVIRARNFFERVNAKLGFKPAATVTTSSPHTPVMLPDSATIYAAPVNLNALLQSEKYSGFWRHQVGAPSNAKNNQSNLNFSRIGRMLFESTIAEVNPFVEQLPQGCLNALGAVPQELKRYDLMTCSVEDVLVAEGTVPMVFSKEAMVGHQLSHGGDAAMECDVPSSVIDGISVWFDVACDPARFIIGGGTLNTNKILLPTGPADLPTHWKQSTVLFPREMCRDPEARLDARAAFSDAATNDAAVTSDALPSIQVSIKCEDHTTRVYELDVELV